ncbi:MAG: LptE family protein [Bacteroidales bacterium]|nr:LptE family protein [Bacteroidales bacterium]MBN2820594.1 LptE family protein [Bacteroidales bacterium]
MTLIKLYKIKSLVLISAFTVLFTACFSIRYDFKGGVNIDPSIKTFSVQYFDNRAQLVEPTFSQSFTNELREYIESNTNLKYVNGMGDVDFSGSVSNYQIAPQAISKTGTTDKAAMTRFTISIKFSYMDVKDPENDFEKTVSGYRDFDSNTNFNSVEEDLSEELREELIEQVFNAAFVNW